MYGVLLYIFACFIYSVCTAHAVPWWEQNFSTETMCVCWLLLGRIISLVKNAQYASNQSKRGQPEKYQLMLSRVCGAELDAKPWRCEDEDFLRHKKSFQPNPYFEEGFRVRHWQMLKSATQIYKWKVNQRNINFLLSIFFVRYINILQYEKANSEICGPPDNKFDLEVGSRSPYGANWKGLSQESCMPYIDTVSLIHVLQMWSFMWQMDNQVLIYPDFDKVQAR